MKKGLVILLCIGILSPSGYAQLLVESNGNVAVKPSSAPLSSSFSVNSSGNSNATTFIFSNDLDRDIGMWLGKRTPADTDNDYSMGINNYSYLVVNTTQCPLNPCLFDIGGISDNIYIGEKKELRNVTININRAYWIDDMEIKNVQLDNSITTIDVDNQCLVKKSTFVPIGSSILIK